MFCAENFVQKTKSCSLVTQNPKKIRIKTGHMMCYRYPIGTISRNLAFSNLALAILSVAIFDRSSSVD